jgi:hypothetical protein
MLDLTGFFVNHHQAGFITIFGWFKRNEVYREIKLEFR